MNVKTAFVEQRMGPVAKHAIFHMRRFFIQINNLLFIIKFLRSSLIIND